MCICVSHLLPWGSLSLNPKRDKSAQNHGVFVTKLIFSSGVTKAGLTVTHWTGSESAGTSVVHSLLFKSWMVSSLLQKLCKPGLWIFLKPYTEWSCAETSLTSTSRYADWFLLQTSLACWRNSLSSVWPVTMRSMLRSHLQRERLCVMLFIYQSFLDQVPMTKCKVWFFEYFRWSYFFLSILLCCSNCDDLDILLFPSWV